MPVKLLKHTGAYAAEVYLAIALDRESSCIEQLPSYLEGCPDGRRDWPPPTSQSAASPLFRDVMDAPTGPADRSLFVSDQTRVECTRFHRHRIASQQPRPSSAHSHPEPHPLPPSFRPSSPCGLALSGLHWLWWWSESALRGRRWLGDKIWQR